MNLLDLALEIMDARLQPFVAPIPSATVVTAWTIQSNVTYQFPLREVDPGWWEIAPSSASEARVTQRAQPAQYLGYLTELPRLYVIVLYRLEAHTWLCTPYNLSDATQRGWENGEPRVLHLVCHSVQPFDLVDARLLGDVLLFHRVDDRLDTSGTARICRGLLGMDADDHLHPAVGQGFCHAFHFLQQRIEAERMRQIEEARRLAQEEVVAQRERELATTEGRLKWYLEFMGADLQGWTESGEMFEVTWTYDGHTHSARISRDLRLDSAGICLGHRGQEQRQNLSSVVAVIQEARRLHRFDMDQRSWL